MGHVWHGNRQQLKESRLFPCGNSYSLRGDHWTEWPEGSWLEAPMLLRAVPDGGRLRPCWSRGDFPLSLVMCCWWCWDASFKASPWSGSLTPSSPAHPPHTLPNLCCALIMYSKPSESWVEYWLLFYPQSRDPYLPLLLGPATNTFHGGRFSAEYPLPSIDSGVHHWTPSTRLNTWQGVGGSNICWMARQMKSLQSCQSPICPSTLLPLLTTSLPVNCTSQKRERNLDPPPSLASGQSSPALTPLGNLSPSKSLPFLELLYHVPVWP